MEIVEVTLEDFALANHLPEEWVALRHECESIVRDPQFWTRPELQNTARELAVRASDILRNVIQTKKMATSKTR